MKRLLAAALLLPLLVPAAWLLAEWRLQAAVQAWAAGRTAEGWTVRSGPAAWAGFPFAAALVLPDLALSSPPAPQVGGLARPAPGGLDWSVARLELRVSPLHPLTLALRPQGPQRLRLALPVPLDVQADDARIAVPLRPDSDVPIVAAAAALRLATPDDAAGTATTNHASTGRAGTDRVSTGALSLALSLHPDAARGQAAATVRLDAADVILPGLPVALRTLSLAGAVEGPLAPRPTPAATAAAWRDGGGRVVVQRFAARWGDLSASGTATLSLDGALQPAAAATVRLAGYDAALDSLAAAGTLGRGAATATRAVLGLMARAEPDGTRSVELPITWRAGTISAGQIPLLRTPPVDWALGTD